MSRYQYKSIVIRFLALNNLSEENFSEAILTSEKMEKINDKWEDLICQEDKEQQCEDLMTEWVVLGKELVACFQDYPDFQESLDAYRWTNGIEKYIRRAAESSLKIVDVYGECDYDKWF
jgi:hypothetical protein